MLGLLTLLACETQYLAIPGARPLVGEVQNVAVEAAPTFTIPDGATLPAAVGESVTLDVPIDESWPFTPNEIVFTVWITETLSYAEYWVYEIQPEERAAGHALIEIILTTRRLEPERCSPWHVGTRVCFGPVRYGIETMGMFLTTGDGGPASLGVEVPVTLAPLETYDDGTDPGGQCQTYENCCGCIPDPNLGTNICPLECYEVPSCGCPSGSTPRGEGPQGTIACECPT